ncbi:MAG TPA: hypothetical protein VH851_08365 [Candidatus Binatia bacterium]
MKWPTATMWWMTGRLAVPPGLTRRLTTRRKPFLNIKRCSPRLSRLWDGMITNYFIFNIVHY